MSALFVMFGETTFWLCGTKGSGEKKTNDVHLQYGTNQDKEVYQPTCWSC